MAVKTADIKKRVIRGQRTTQSPAPLYVNEHGGEMWACNRYWLTRAERVAPLLEQYNLSAAEPGVFEVNGTVRCSISGRAGVPSIPAEMMDAERFKPGIRVRVAGQEVFTRDGYDNPMALYRLANGSHAGLLADELAWLSDQATARLPEDDLRYGEVSVLFRKSGTGHVSAMIRAEVYRVTAKAYYTDKIEGQRQDYVPEVRVPEVRVLDDLRVLGVMMGLSYS